jgi:hypothetical protein
MWDVVLSHIHGYCSHADESSCTRVLEVTMVINVLKAGVVEPFNEGEARVFTAGATLVTVGAVTEIVSAVGTVAPVVATHGGTVVAATGVVAGVVGSTSVVGIASHIMLISGATLMIGAFMKGFFRGCRQAWIAQKVNAIQ